nr:unnamed protein product [Digitaria exilis]
MHNRWRPANGGATGAPLGPMAWRHGVVGDEIWSSSQPRTSRHCPPPGTTEEERGAVSSLVCPSPVDSDGGGSSYGVVVVSAMLARLPAAGVGCLATAPVLLHL